MLISYKRSQTSVVLRVKILNSSVTTGAGLTGLTFSSSGLIISTIADNESTATAYTVAGSTIETISTLGTFATPTATKCRFKEVDSTNHKGIYEIQIDNARFAVSNAKSLLVSISGATNAAETDAVIPLTDMDPYDTVRGGMTALPNTACTGNASLITSGSGTDQITVSGGVASADAKKINAVSTSSVTTVSANVGTTQPVNFTGTGASAYAKCDVIDIAGAAVSTSSAQLGVNVVSYASGQTPLQPTVAGRTLDVSATGEAGLDWANIGSPTTTVGLTGTTISTGQTITSVSGSVGSVSGAVGSVTGNVGGNVAGSVASVTAAVATTSNIKKNQALTKFAFMMTDSTNHAPATSKTVTCTRSIDGAAFGSGTLANVTEIANGMYCVDFGSADLNGNVILLRATATGCDDTVERIVTQP